jgi:VanZ family protein
MAMDSRRVVPLAAAGLATAAILVATLTPDVRFTDAAPIPPIESAPFSLSDFARNVILFAPLGASLLWGGVAARRAIGLAALLSAGVELAQGWLPIPGRDASAGDLLANTAGAGLGIALFRSGATWLRPSPVRSGHLAVAAGVAAAAVLCATGLLLVPAPTDAEYFGLHSPSLAHLAPYDGSVIDAAIDDTGIPLGSLSDSARIRARLGGDYAVRLRARAGSAPPPYLAAWLMIADAAQNEILLLGPDRDDLVYRYRSRGYALGFETASLRLPHALRRIAPGDEVAISVQRLGGDLCVAVDRAPQCGLGPTLGDGWSLLAPDYRILAQWRPVVCAAWLAALFAPLGYWGRRTAANAAVWAAAAGALVLVPAVAALRPTPVSQFAGAGCGALFGAVARRLVAGAPSRVGREA